MQPTPSDKSAPPDITPEWLDIVRLKASALRFGSIQITIHEGRVTQVESIEKTRFQAHSEQGRQPSR